MAGSPKVDSYFLHKEPFSNILTYGGFDK